MQASTNFRLPVRRLAVALAPLMFLSLTVGCPALLDLLDPNTPTDMNDVNDPNDGNDANDPNDANEPNEPSMGNSGLTGQFVGSDRCSLCHVRTHEDWEGTLHARALESLEEIGQANNENCIGCHVVGFGEEGGFESRATTNALAGVGCEACHGPGRAHVENIADETLHPPKDISSDICGTCHQGTHHPHFEEWSESSHAGVPIGERFVDGDYLNRCGSCHSGDFFYQALIEGETLEDDAFFDRTVEELNGVTCAICHNPHAQTNNAPTPEDGRDFQLRFPEVTNPTPVNTIDQVTNRERFNICGQCHHSRGRDWTTTSRKPHSSNQVNMYIGEMPLPDEDSTPLVLSRVSVHSFATEQCATCHMYRQDFQSEIAPAIAGHTFQVNNESCSTSGCHPSADQALAVGETLQNEVQARLDGILARLGDPATWEYVAAGGPEDQSDSNISQNVKKIRFLYYYVLADGSLGLHNPSYTRDMLQEAEDLLDAEGL